MAGDVLRNVEIVCDSTSTIEDCVFEGVGIYAKPLPHPAHQPVCFKVEMSPLELHQEEYQLSIKANILRGIRLPNDHRKVAE